MYEYSLIHKGVITNHIVHNDNSMVGDLQAAFNLMNINMATERNAVRNSIFNNPTGISKDKEKYNTLLTENKFLNMKWDVILEDQSSLSSDISQIKILLKIRYMNLTSLEEKELDLLFDEKSFEVTVA
jgi:hypothetical protein